jgi:hypothetical protein
LQPTTLSDTLSLLSQGTIIELDLEKLISFLEDKLVEGLTLVEVIELLKSQEHYLQDLQE